MTWPVGHAGHWIVDLLYVVPLVAFIGWLLIVNLRARRAGGERPERPDDPPAA